jgi:hypothetical protein
VLTPSEIASAVCFGTPPLPHRALPNLVDVIPSTRMQGEGCCSDVPLDFGERGCVNALRRASRGAYATSLTLLAKIQKYIQQSEHLNSYRTFFSLAEQHFAV